MMKKIRMLALALCCLVLTGSIAMTAMAAKLAKPVLSSVSCTAAGVTVKWSAVDGAEKYGVYRKGPKDTAWVLMGKTTGVSYVDKTVESSVKYSYSLRCLDSGNTAVSDYASSKTLTYFARPAQVTLNLVATGITVSWDAVPGAGSYNVYRKGTGDADWVKMTNTKSTSWTDTKTVSGTKYSYCARTVDAGGTLRNTYSPYKSLTFYDRPVLSSLSNTATGVTVKWGAVQGAGSYNVYRKGPGDTAWVKMANTKSTSWVDTKAVSGTKYSYRVRTLDAGGTLRNTNSLYKTLTYYAVPKLSGLSNTAAGVTVKWGAVQGAGSYNVYRKGPGDTDWVKMANTKSTSWTDTKAANATKYSYSVRTVDAGGTLRNTYSAYKSITFYLRPTMKSVSLVSTGLTVKWKAVSGAGSYHIYRKGPGETSWVKMTNTTGTSWTDTAVESGKTYTYSARTVDAGGTVRNTYADGISAVYYDRPTAPKLANAAGGVQVEWTAVAGAGGYEVDRRLPTETAWTAIGTTREPRWLDTAVESGVKYVYSMRTLNAEGEPVNAYASYNSITFHSQPVITETVDQNEGISLTWTPVPGAAKYRVYRMTPTDTEWKTLVNTTETSVLDTKVNAGTEYTYSIRTLDADGVLRSARSESVTVARKSLDVTAYINVPMIGLHTERSEESPLVFAPYMAEVSLPNGYPTTEKGQWVTVEYQGETRYYWQAEGRQTLHLEKSERVYQTTTSLQREVINLALSYADLPTGYRKTAEGASTGVPDENGVYWFDCSGFTGYVLNTVMQRYAPAYLISIDVDDVYKTGCILNKNLPGEFSATTVIPTGGAMDISLLQPGDLLFFNEKNEEGRTVDHVGIYLGKNEMVHAAQTFAVNVTTLTEREESFVGAIRFLPEEVTPANTTMYTINTTKLLPARDVNAEPILRIEAQQPVNVRFINGKEVWAYAEYTNAAGETQEGFIYYTSLTREPPVTVEETRYVGKNQMKLYTDRDTQGEYITLDYGEELTYRGRYGTSNFWRAMLGDKEYYFVAEPSEIDTVLLMESPWFSETRYVLKGSQNLYTKRDATSGAEHITVPVETALEYQGRYGTTSYYRVIYNGSVYYVYTTADIDQFLTPDAPTSVEEKRYVGKNQMKLYPKPDTQGEYITLDYGEELTYQGRCGTSNFHRVTLDGRTYYIVAEPSELDTVLLPESPWFSETRYVLKSSLNLYTQRDATTGAEHITVPVETELEYQGRFGTTSFYRVVYNGSVYYVYTTEDIDQLLTTDAPISVEEKRYVGKNQMKLYPNPDTQGEYITLDYGEELTYRGRCGTSNFHRVTLHDTMYYIVVEPAEMDTALLTASPWFHETRYVVKAAQNLYTQRDATTDAEHITVPIGTELEYQGRFGDTKFYRVIYDDTVYYIYTTGDIEQFIWTDLDAVLAVESYKTVATSTWLRTSMDSSTDDNKIRSLPVGETLGVIEVSSGGSWVYVLAEDGTYGFTLSSKLTDAN